MAKQRSVWMCKECGLEQPKWTGQCPGCEAWNAFVEQKVLPLVAPRFESQSAAPSKPVRLREVEGVTTHRISSGIPECDRLLGGGIVPGSLLLVGGEPGIGKSTLLTQLSAAVASRGDCVLYISGEESVEQASLRAKRLKVDSDNLYLVSETNISLIRSHIEALKPALVIVDSIQMVYKSEISSTPGSVSQVRECTGEFLHIAKGQGVTVVLVGHVTKSGEIAGPRVLEHMVDTVLYFEGDKQNHYRIVRVVKNRFGATDEIGVFHMESGGLREVQNPSELFLEERTRDRSGSVIIPTLEGSRPILVEVQSLVTKTSYSTPSRRSTGVDSNRLALLVAVLEKRLNYQMYLCDVFVSAAGGLKMNEPAVDLGILLAIASSYSNHLVDPDTVVVGEVGLGGEIRSVSRLEARVKEVIHMGFRRCLVPKQNVATLDPELKQKVELIGVSSVEDAIKQVIKQ